MIKLTRPAIVFALALTGAGCLTMLSSPNASAAPSARAADVMKFWTPERRASAVPRDLVVDDRGQGYLRRRDGGLEPYGRRVTAQAESPSVRAKPGGSDGSSDIAEPQIDEMIPGGDAEIGSSALFSAKITDESGLKSVSFVIVYPSGTTQSFRPDAVAGNIWQISLSGFTAGAWNWYVVATDNSARGGNTATSATLGFTVIAGGGSDSSSGSDPDGVVTNARWNGGGAVQNAAGRIYFEMLTQSGRGRWATFDWRGYVCSGTVADDDTTSGRSVILTAAHCVYDDVNKGFARNVLFIPNQDGTTGEKLDADCANDPIGCWVPAFGVVDPNWTNTTFPDNIPWDYAYYVVPDSGAHLGAARATEALDIEAGSLAIDFGAPQTGAGAATQALGYSWNYDPYFMYCAEDMTTVGTDNWWLASCGLSGGSSGGPWLQPVSGANEAIISVNSWGYTNSPGMAGPKLSGTTAACLFGKAKAEPFANVQEVDGEAGIVPTCP